MSVSEWDVETHMQCDTHVGQLLILYSRIDWR